MNDNDLKNLILQTLGMKSMPDDWTDETNDLVQKINFVYEGQIKKALSLARWSFANELMELIPNKEIDNNNSKYSNSFMLPNDFIILINPFLDKTQSYVINDFEIKNKTFYSNTNTIYLNYIKRTDTELFPEYFIDYLKYKIASEVCFYFTGDTDLLNILLQKTREELIIARNTDMKNKKTNKIDDNPFFYARF